MPAILITTAGQFSAAIARRLASDTKLVEAAALDACMAGVADAVKATNKADAVDQGLYKLSWGARPAPRGAVLENTAPYAAILEYGRRPNRPGPPLLPILGWVRRKLVANGAVTEANAYGAAVAIRDAIHFRGTKPRRILGGILPALTARFTVAVHRQLRRRPA